MKLKKCLDEVNVLCCMFHDHAIPFFDIAIEHVVVETLLYTQYMRVSGLHKQTNN